MIEYDYRYKHFVLFAEQIDAMCKKYNKDVLSNECDLHDLLN